jgi:hypothetical protein
MGTRKIRSIHIRKNAQRLNVVGVNRHTIDNGNDVRMEVDWQLI